MELGLGLGLKMGLELKLKGYIQPRSFHLISSHLIQSVYPFPIPDAVLIATIGWVVKFMQHMKPNCDILRYESKVYTF